MEASTLLCSDQEWGSWTLTKAETEVSTLWCPMLPPNVLPPEHMPCDTRAAGDTRISRTRQLCSAVPSAQGEGRHLQGPGRLTFLFVCWLPNSSRGENIRKLWGDTKSKMCCAGPGKNKEFWMALIASLRMF